MTELKNVATDFGPVSMKLEVGADGKEASLTAAVPKSEALTGIIVHLGAWAAEGKAALQNKETAFEMTIPSSLFDFLQCLDDIPGGLDPARC